MTSPPPFRIGQGFDVHRLVPGRRLILGGVEIPFDRGLEGHSDADVLTHAICDALLGAAALGDIGGHFPDTDVAFKDADSLKLLHQTVGLVRSKRWAIGNIDATVIAQAPRISPYIEPMRVRLGEAMGLDPDLIGIKATTSERLGFTGRGEGIAAMAVVLLISQS
jgi:2-C-methyl-D-erythritol 2,4-cyclodiphosphate synthase